MNDIGNEIGRQLRRPYFMIDLGIGRNRPPGKSKQSTETDRWNLTTLIPFNVVTLPKERLMAETKKPSEKRPGENPEGKYHFNPGNMAGKKPGDAEQTDENRGAPHQHKEKPAD
jgi:hypothetical protein